MLTLMTICKLFQKLLVLQKYKAHNIQVIMTSAEKSTVCEE